MYAGASIILAGETLRTFFLLGRYFSYVPVTRNNVIPTYIRGAFATANPIPVMLFWFEALVIFAWWVLQFVSESESGIFNAVSGNWNWQACTTSAQAVSARRTSCPCRTW